MTKSDLIAAAKELSPPPSDAADEYSAVRDALAAKVTNLLRKRPDFHTVIGEGNESMMADNHRNHVRFMDSMFHVFRPDILVDTILWVFATYRAHGFSETYWPIQLRAWLDVLSHELSPQSFEAIAPIYEWMLSNTQNFSELADDAGAAASGEIQNLHRS